MFYWSNKLLPKSHYQVSKRTLFDPVRVDGLIGVDKHFFDCGESAEAGDALSFFRDENVGNLL